MAKKPTPKKTDGFARFLVSELKVLVLAIINKGAAPPLSISVVMIIVAFRMPPENLVKFVEILTDSKLIFVVIILAALFFIFIMVWLNIEQRKMYKDEIARLSEERNKYQELAIGHPVRSSNEP